jgi:calcium/calmodulin-dependent protein kinase I
MNLPSISSNTCQTEEYWANVSNTAKDFVSSCLTIDPTQRPTVAEILRHRWLAEEKPQSVPDTNSPTGPGDLLPHVQKRMGGKARCEFLRRLIFVEGMLRQCLAVHKAVWEVIAMNRMSTLATLSASASGELGAKIVKYKEESEKEDIDVAFAVFFHINSEQHLTLTCRIDRKVMHHHNQGENEETVDDGA